MRSLAVVAMFLATLSVANADFYLHNELDVSVEMSGMTLFSADSAVGTNPSAVTTDGSSIWVAGYKSGGSGGTGLVKITEPWGAAPAAQQLAQIADTPANRGYSGLTYNGGKVFAAYDHGGDHASGLTAWDSSTGANAWSYTARCGSGVAYDPGFDGAGMGTAWTKFGTGRRALVDSDTGADIYTTSDGMIINGAGTGTFWRDMDFAPNGNIWLREGNNLIKATRTGANGCATAELIVDEPEADYVNGQNLEYLEGLGAIIYNDRETSGTEQGFFDVIKIVNEDGTISGINLLAGDGSALPIDFAFGAGYYDFDYSADTDELLISDFWNRKIYRFTSSAVPEPASLALLALGGLALVRRK